MKKQARKPRPPQAAVAAKISLPTLKKGEIYVGGTIDVDGKVTHTILLPKEKEVPNWQAGMTFAKTEGGDLPNRIEQAMLWAHHADKFQKRYYWSNAQYAGNAAYAWVQSFDDGNQDGWLKGSEGMARAVRRVTI